MSIGIIYAVIAFTGMLQMILIINRVKATEYKETIDKRLCNLLIFFAGFCFMDCWWGIAYSGELFVSKTAFTIISYGYHTAAALSAYMWFGYAIYYEGAEGKHKLRLNIIRNILIAVQLSLIASNLLTHNGFYVESDGSYHMGSLRTHLYAIQYSYYLVLTVYSLAVYFKTPNKRYGDAVIFSIIPLAFGIGQYIFYDVAMYSIGFTVTAFAIYSFNVTAQREEFLTERINMQDRKQTSIIHGLAGNFVAIYYVDFNTGSYEMYSKSPDGEQLIKTLRTDRDYFGQVSQMAAKLVVGEDREAFFETFTKENIELHLKDKKSFEYTTRLKYNNQVKYYRYKVVRSLTHDEDGRIIVGVYDVDEEIKNEQKRQEEIRKAQEEAQKLSEDVYIDSLTQLYNRKAYEHDLEKYDEEKVEDNLIYISMDLNGLKTVNDDLGHEAGDELIKGAGNCINRCFAAYGKAYRIGGDEFAALIFADKNKFADIINDFKQTVTDWHGKKVDELTVSYGYATKADYPEHTIRHIADIADRKMYEDKERFYANKGMDRRGRQKVYDAICKSYAKILKVNLSTDSYVIISLADSEKTEEKGFSSRFSLWITGFARSGQVHEEDIAVYAENMDVNYLKRHFRNGNQEYTFFYRRKIGTAFRKVMIEMIKADDYEPNNQRIYLYVKSIEE